ncbi:hypothetical protein ACTIVE_0652 [Actinomadura verrucosospora]|uniref:Uncharacterized protein n=1 Tax=Actinomadura verrucosospora TaxID=46165 RepID=A0A7D3VSK7_ACTVE|nr:hypothetical protein ACTIVE_0652 [Actinomadura verrucosospora]
MTPSPAFRRGAGRPCLDFTATLRHRGTARAVEELTGPAALDAWIRRFGPYGRAEDAGRADAADLLAARVLREAIHRLVTTARDGGPAACDAASRDRVNTAAARPVPVPALDAAGRLRHHAGEPVAAALAVLARDALDLVTSSALASVRAWRRRRMRRPVPGHLPPRDAPLVLDEHLRQPRQEGRPAHPPLTPADRRRGHACSGQRSTTHASSSSPSGGRGGSSASRSRCHSMCASGPRHPASRSASGRGGPGGPYGRGSGSSPSHRASSQSAAQCAAASSTWFRSRARSPSDRSAIASWIIRSRAS